MTFKANVKTLIFKILPLKRYLKFSYKYYHGKELDLDNPTKFSEKLEWLLVYNGKYNLDLARLVYDKYRVRKYIAEKVGDEHLPKLYGIYSDVNQINFDDFPDKYVIKITQSCGFNIINNGTLDMTHEEIKKQLKTWLDCTNNSKYINNNMREQSYYFDGKAQIICEEYLEDKDGKVCVDSAFFCFNGEPKFWDIVYDSVKLDEGIKNEGLFPRNIYDIEGNYIPMILGRPTDEKLGRTDYVNFDEMVKIAGELSKGWPFIRVDLYNADGRIIVGELTPIPLGGAAEIEPVEYDYEWGKLIDLPQCDNLFE